MDNPIPLTRDLRVQLFVVDNHREFRDALLRLLASQPLVNVVGAASLDQVVVDGVMDAHPDVVVLDLGLRAFDPGQVIRRLRGLEPTVRIVILSLVGDADTRRRALKAGADAFVQLERPVEEMLSASCTPANPA